MFFMDIRYIIIVGPAMLIALLAQVMVKTAFSKYSRVPVSSGMSGSQAAREMLDRSGLFDVQIERVSGFLSDHYDPAARILRLSPDVHDGRSLASVGVACHEAGHALQHAREYAPLALRNHIVPLASIGSHLSWGMIGIGFLLMWLGLVVGGKVVAMLGVWLFGAVVVFQLITLPVEFNASSRAKKQLKEMGIVRSPEEEAGVASVLNAAAATYIAATVTALAQLLYFLMLINGRDE